jgi:hypothetical protein
MPADRYVQGRGKKLPCSWQGVAVRRGSHDADESAAQSGGGVYFTPMRDASRAALHIVKTYWLDMWVRG